MISSVVSYAIDTALPVAIPIVEEYAGASAATFLLGVGRGYNFDFEHTLAVGSENYSYETSGLMLGATLSAFSCKNGSKGATNTKVSEFARRELNNVGEELASRKNGFMNWFSQRTARVIEKETRATTATSVERVVEKVAEKTGFVAKENPLFRAVKEKAQKIIKEQDIIHVTPQGVAIPSGSKYQIPKNLSENTKRAGSYGEYINGKFLEKLRIDPATTPGSL